MIRRFTLSVLFVLCAARAYAADPAPPPPAEVKPVLQLEAGGPTAAVTAMVFSKDGKTLYTAGLDKVVRVWQLGEDKKAPWTLTRSFRVPIGPDVAGAINALALSPEGRWLAVGGRSVMRGGSEFRQPGLVVPISALSEEMWLDSGTIHVFDLQKAPQGGKVLRGHQGEVRALAFAPQRDGKPPLLVSAGIERGRGKPFGSLRLWDVDAGGAAVAIADLPTPTFPEEHFKLDKERPALAVWHTGDEKSQVRAIVVWPEFDLTEDVKIADITDALGRMCLWDAAAKGKDTLQFWRIGPGNNGAGLLGFEGNEPRVVTGSITQFGDGGTTGGLRVRTFSRDADTKATLKRQVPFTFDRVRHRPFALTPVSSKGDGSFDTVAAVLQRFDDDPNHVLVLVDVNADPAKARVRFSLGSSDTKHQPVIAAAPQGQWLAVAGFKDRAIEMYELDDLFAGRTKPAARLESKGIHYAKALFVRREGETGLWLTDKPGAKPLDGGAYFSFDKRALTDDAKAWKVDAPDRGGLEPKWSFNKQTGVYSAAVGNFPRIALEPGQQPTWYALRPATAQRKPGLFAVAHTNRQSAETYITLFDLEKGRPLRQFTGHLQDIRYLEFSDTQPLFVSVSEDQTVNVWSFADLGAGVGMIQGLVVSDSGGKVVARAVVPGSEAAKAGVEKGDTLEGFLVDNKVREVKSAVDFYWQVNLKKPGDVVELKLTGKKAARVTAGQGVDERKPLLSLFVTREGREWIGWTPGGPFDRSSDRADAFIGWHTNTGKPEQPALFTLGGEAQKEFHKENILKYLIAKGNFAAGLEAWENREKGPPPQPDLTPDIEGARRLDLNNPELLHTRTKAVKLTATLQEAYPLDAADTMEWRLTQGDDTKPQPMKRGIGNRAWEADLSKLLEKNREIEVEVLFNAPKRGISTKRQLTLRYQPPAPALVAVAENTKIEAGKEAVVVVKENKVRIDVSVKPEPGQKVEVRFIKVGAKSIKTQSLEKEAALSEEFTLEDPTTQIEIVAVNKDAFPGLEKDETTTLRVQVQVQKPEKQPTPRIAALRLTPESSASFIDKKDGKEEKVLVVDVETIKVVTAIQAEHPLTLVEWSDGDKTAKLTPDPAKNGYVLEQTVELKAGVPKTLLVRAATKTSDVAQATVRVVYHPLLPVLKIEVPASGESVFDGQVVVRGSIALQAAKEKHEIAVRVLDAKGKEVGPAKVVVDEKSGLWTANVPVAPGENVIEATVKNAWRPAVTRSATVTYKRPPKIEPIGEVKVGDKPFVTLKDVRVWSPLGVLLTGILLNGQDVGKDKLALEETQTLMDGLKLWNVTVKDVPVKEGETSLVFNARNADGLGLNAQTIKVIPPVKLPPKPIATLMIPDQETTHNPNYKAPFHVASESKLLSVELFRGNESVWKSKLDNVKKIDGKFELSDTAPVQLEWKENILKLVAVNEGGGEGKPAVATVTAIRTPVRVVIERIDELTPSSDVRKTHKPLEQTAELVRFDGMDKAYIRVTGRVEWPDENAPQLDDSLLGVELRVNGLLQFPVALDPRKDGKQSNQRGFHVHVVLTEAKNRIEVTLPRLSQGENSGRVFALDCAAPQKEQRLHVLIVGVNVKDGDGLKEFFLTKWGCKEPPTGKEGKFKLEAFPEAWLSGVLHGNVQKEAVIGQLGEIEKQIRVLQKQAPEKGINDVVLVYYQGGEVMDARGNLYLKTTPVVNYPNLPLNKYAIAYSDLPRLPGLQMMILTVSPPTTQGDAVATKEFPIIKGTVTYHYVYRNPEDALSASPKGVAILGDALKKEEKLGPIARTVTEQVQKDDKAVKQESFFKVSPEHAGKVMTGNPR